MLDREFFISLDDFTARIAAIVILMGASAIHLMDWKIMGWLLVVLGVEAFVLAYLLANSVEYEVEELDLGDD